MEVRINKDEKPVKSLNDVEPPCDSPTQTVNSDFSEQIKQK